MKILMMMRTKGLLGHVVGKSTTKPTTVAPGAKSAGAYIIYKQNNP